MVIRIKKKLYFKPRRCPDCGKACFFCKCHLSQRCKKCHRKHEHQRKNYIKHQKQRRQIKIGLSKYTSKYKRQRRRLIRQHPYCALCGAETRLTAHHVGGGVDHLTVLCDECHSAYERWKLKQKVKLWKKNLRKKTTSCTGQDMPLKPSEFVS